jgi:hypothetical protein
MREIILPDDSGILPEQEAAISCVMGANKVLFE